ncbi:MAG TPA: protein kinase [Gemmatimonadaceae bacterium]|jgi:serine/threonine-protein kinase
MLPEDQALREALKDRYLIDRVLGRGGMATVFLATDLKHRRSVAIKALNRDLAIILGTKRFLLEIEMTAGLRHPNILPLFDSGEAAGTLFYVTPFIDGDSLRGRLEQAGRLPIEEALRVAREIGNALVYAHDRGIVHRDIKPENVLLDNGHAVVADFGIAFAVSDALGTRLTKDDVALGTPAYMSPEQGRGERAIDARSDQYSLACVLYEMLVGSPPFDGLTGLSVMMKHLKDPVPALDRDDVPDAVREAVARGLEKSRDDRCATLREWLVSLGEGHSSAIDTINRAVSGAVSGARAHLRLPELTVGIETFAGPTNDPELSPITEGLTDDIAAGLSLFPYLTVVRNLDAAPSYLLQGRARRAGNKLRVTVQLVERVSGSQLWGEIYDRDLTSGDAFDIIDGITDRVIATVADPYGVLVRALTEIASAKSLAQLTPHEAVLMYYYFHQRPVPDLHLLARNALERAAMQEPRNPDVWSCLAFLYLDEDRHGFNPRPDALTRALDASRRAISIDPTSANAHRALAEVHFFRGDRDGFQAAADRSIELNRRDGTTVAMLGCLMAVSGQEERGVALTEAAMALNPHHPGWYRFGSFFGHFQRGDFAAALSTAQKINMPDYFFAVMILAAAHAALGHRAEARAARDELVAIVPTIDRDGIALVRKWLRWSPALFASFVDSLVAAGVFTTVHQIAVPARVFDVTAPRQANPSLT